MSVAYLAILSAPRGGALAHLQISAQLDTVAAILALTARALWRRPRRMTQADLAAPPAIERRTHALRLLGPDPARAPIHAVLVTSVPIASGTAITGLALATRFHTGAVGATVDRTRLHFARIASEAFRTLADLGAVSYRADSAVVTAQFVADFHGSFTALAGPVRRTVAA